MSKRKDSKREVKEIGINLRLLYILGCDYEFGFYFKRDIEFI